MSGVKTKRCSSGLKQTRSKRAGLQFPVGRIARLLRKGRYAPRIGNGASVYLTAVLEYLAAEVAELSANVAVHEKAKRITPRHMKLAISADNELHMLMKDVDMRQSGVLPFVHTALLPKSKRPVNNMVGWAKPLSPVAPTVNVF